MTKIERGAVQRTAGAYDSLVSGTKGVGFPGAAVYQEQMPVLEVLLQNDPDSENNILIGGEFGQHIVIVPGQSITVPINDLNDVWASAPTGAATLNWMVMT